jgi:hypothetical protein
MEKFKKAAGWFGAALLTVSQAVPMPGAWQTALVSAGGAITWFARSPLPWKPGLPR